VLVSWEEYKAAAHMYMNGSRKAKAQLELKLVRNLKNNKKGFYKYIDQQMEMKENIPLNQ